MVGGTPDDTHGRERAVVLVVAITVLLSSITVWCQAHHRPSLVQAETAPRPPVLRRTSSTEGAPHPGTVDAKETRGQENGGASPLRIDLPMCPPGTLTLRDAEAGDGLFPDLVVDVGGERVDLDGLPDGTYIALLDERFLGQFTYRADDHAWFQLACSEDCALTVRALLGTCPSADLRIMAESRVFWEGRLTNDSLVELDSLPCGVLIETDLGGPSCTASAASAWSGLDPQVSVGTELGEARTVRTLDALTELPLSGVEVQWMGPDRPQRLGWTSVSGTLEATVPEGNFLILLPPDLDHVSASIPARGDTVEVFLAPVGERLVRCSSAGRSCADLGWKVTSVMSQQFLVWDSRPCVAVNEPTDGWLCPVAVTDEDLQPVFTVYSQDHQVLGEVSAREQGPVLDVPMVQRP